MKAHARILFGVPDCASIQEGLVMRLHFRLVQYVAEIQFSPLSACEFCGSHSGMPEYSGRLGCDAVLLAEGCPTFRWDVLP
jgi:hypothetical protein